jgi:hypothetical protein
MRFTFSFNFRNYLEIIFFYCEKVKSLRNSMAGGNEAQRSDRMELPKDSDDESERHVVRLVEAVTALRFVPACHDEKMNVLHRY